MQTNFTSEQLADPDIDNADGELRACLQCGYCLAICPTYQVSGDELDSPRGRVRLIKDMLESARPPDDQTVAHIDRCLSCLACMSACPSRVHYMHLVDHARIHIENNYRRPLFDRATRWLLARILPYPDRFRLALRAARLVNPLAFAMPEKIRRMVEFAPRTLPPPSPNDQPRVFPAMGARVRRVALMTGCAQQALNTHINDATIRILRRHGCEVVVAPGAGCCGALTYHMGKSREGLDAAAGNIRAWVTEARGAGLDAIVTGAGGCGTMVKDYGHIFRNDSLAGEAATVSALAKDIAEVLSGIELVHKAVPKLRVTYHTSCSLQHGQRFRYGPKKLLKAAGFSVIEPDDPHMCCGSAGTYNLLQPEISDRLKERKIKTLERSSPDAIVAGSIGCMIQIGSGTGLPVVHTVELLDWATGGPMPPALEAVAKAGVAAA
jgi:glycolate oxidase iron-sulfur subunit